jgi:hypothetical protein
MCPPKPQVRAGGGDAGAALQRTAEVAFMPAPGVEKK